MRNEDRAGKKEKHGMTVSDIKSLFCFTDEGLIMMNARNDVELCARKTHQDAEKPFSQKPTLQPLKVKTKSGKRGMEEKDVNDGDLLFCFIVFCTLIYHLGPECKSVVGLLYANVME